MTETIFSIFVYFQDGVATEYGVQPIRCNGTDVEKLNLLRSRVDKDFKTAHRFSLGRSFTPEEWRAAHRLGNVTDYFEEAFDCYKASRSPLYCLTPIVDGHPMVDMIIGDGPFRGDIVTAIPGGGSVPDYLAIYVDNQGFHFTQLIHDDYFKAIKMLFNNGLYVSCAKLLMSCIDSMAYVEFGDVKGNFERWLEEYSDLSRCGITPAELWEFRNSLLHMTNLNSRKVRRGETSGIIPFIGGVQHLPSIHPSLPKPSNLYILLQEIGSAICRWGESYNHDKDKLLKFIERYDETISDSRMAVFSLNSPSESYQHR